MHWQQQETARCGPGAITHTDSLASRLQIQTMVHYLYMQCALFQIQHSRACVVPSDNGDRLHAPDDVKLQLAEAGAALIVTRPRQLRGKRRVDRPFMIALNEVSKISFPAQSVLRDL